MDNNRSEEINIFSKESLIIFVIFFYISSIAYGIALMKNNEWTKENGPVALIIFLSIVIFDFIAMIICVKFKLCKINLNLRRRRMNFNNSQLWFQIVDISSITEVIQRNFQVIEDIQQEEIEIGTNNKNESQDYLEMKTCLICNNKYEKVDGTKSIKYIKLECQHDFCEGCISKWCNKKNTCPLCREEILKESDMKLVATV